MPPLSPWLAIFGEPVSHVAAFVHVQDSVARSGIDDAETIDTPYTELEKRIAKSIIPGVDVDAVDGTLVEL